MKRIVVLLALFAVALSGCRRTTNCTGTITGPEMHRDTVSLRCK